MTKQHMVSALNETLHTAMDNDERIVVLGEDVGVDGGVFRVTNNLYEEYGEERVIDTPLAEAGIIGSSIGMAINGLKPIPEIQFSGFTYQAFHQIKQHVARFRQRTEGSKGLPMVIRAPSTGGIEALEHHSESPENFYVHSQGLKVAIPSNPQDAKGLLNASIADPDPVIFLEPKKIYRSFKEEVPDEHYQTSLGKARTVKEGTDLTIITWGATVHVVKEAEEALQQEGIDAEIIDLRTLVPLDQETVIESVKKTNRALIAYESAKTGGYGAELASRIQEECIYHLEGPIRRAASFDIPYPQFAWEDDFLVNPDRVVREAKKTFE